MACGFHQVAFACRRPVTGAGDAGIWATASVNAGMNATPTIEARDMLRNPSIGLRRTGAAIVLALFFAPVPAVGRQTTDDPELARLKIEAEKAAKRAEIAESEKKIREASIPAVSPVDGKTEIDQKLVVEVQVLAHRAVSTIADRIAALVGQKAGDDERSCCSTRPRLA
jgi:hypothetical protein